MSARALLQRHGRAAALCFAVLAGAPTTVGARGSPKQELQYS